MHKCGQNTTMHSRGNVQQDARSQQDEQEGGCQEVIHLLLSRAKIYTENAQPARDSPED
jgi:hypothetical protein